MSKRLTQDEMVLRHLQSGEAITPAEAVAEYGCYRLAAVIHKLRKHHHINAHTESSTNRFGAKVKYARYRMALTKYTELTPAADMFVYNSEKVS